MSKCSKKCNEIKKKIDSISGLDDNKIYSWLENLEAVVDVFVEQINNYADEENKNGTCFKDEEEEFIKLLKLVPDDLKPGEGVIKKCPRCGAKLRIERASYNGHLWITCEKEGVLLCE